MNETREQRRTPLKLLFYRLLWLRLFTPLLVSSLITIGGVWLLASQEIIKQMQTLNTSMVYSVGSYLNDASNALDTLALRTEVSDAEQTALSMEVVLEGYEFFDGFYYLDAAGHVQAIAPHDDRYLGLDFSRQEYYRQALKTNRVVISAPFLSLRSGQPAVTLARRDKLGGIIAGELSLAELQRLVTSRIHTNMPFATMVIDQTGTMLANPQASLVSQQVNASNMQITHLANIGGGNVIYWYNNSAYLGNSAVEPISGWKIMSYTKASQVYMPYALPAVAFGLISTAVLTLFLRMFSTEFQRHVVTPLSRLSQATGEIASGSYPALPETLGSPQSFDELATLTENFLNMTNAVVERENQLQEMASHDPLTNLANRTLLHKRLEEQIATAQMSDSEFAVLFVDLDDFKTVNDAFGHNTGDMLLNHIAHLLEACCEQGDFISRLGGDEFALIINRQPYTRSVEKIAECILRQLNRPMQIRGQEIYITCSIGISIFPLDGSTGDTLLQNADTAMYQSKSNGKNTLAFYSLEMETRAQERHRLSAAMHHALEQAEFKMVYQPIYSAATCCPAGSEALIRWHNPRLGDVPPARFIPLANDTGLILPLGEWILNTACSENQRLAGPGARDMWMGVNVSERQLRHAGFLDSVRRALDETGLPPGRLMLELTENIFFQGFTEIDALLLEVKRMGVLLALDDFGTGYSTLSCLTQIPFDVIKIDRSLSQHITTSPRQAAIVRGILQIAHDLGMQVVAEGIENEEQLRFYESLGCDLLQGFYFNRPLQSDAFRQLLGEGRKEPQGS